MSSRNESVFAGSILAGSAVAGYAAAGDLRVLLAPAGVALTYLFTTRSIWRLIFVVGGGTLVLQSESTTNKIVYVAGVTVCLAIATIRVGKEMRANDAFAAFRPVLLAGYFLTTIVIFSYVISASNGVGFVLWFRAAITYALLGLLPLVGLDAAIDSSPKAIRRVFIVVTLVAPLSFMTNYIDRRGVGSLPFGQFALTSIALCAALLGYSLARLTASDNRVRWFAAALYVPMAVLLTGTRSGIALFGGVAGALGPSKKLRLPTAKVAAAAAGMGAALFYLVPIIGGKLTSEPDFYSRRFATIGALLNSSDTGYQDASLLLRQQTIDRVLQAFHDSPFFGDGPGYVYVELEALDTPLAPLAYYGLAGALGLLTLAVCWFVTTKKLRSIGGYSIELTAFRVFVVSLLCFSPLGAITDDKGLGLGLCLFSALLVSSTLARTSERDKLAAEKPQS
jgi:hypothetical protein